MSVLVPTKVENMHLQRPNPCIQFSSTTKFTGFALNNVDEINECPLFDFHQHSFDASAALLNTRKSTISTPRCEASCSKFGHQVGRLSTSGIRTSEAENGNIRSDEIVLRVHVLPRLGHLFLDEITTDRIVEIVAAMRDDEYAPGTVGRVIVILRYLFNLARKWNVLGANENPAAGIPVPPDVQRNRFLDNFEIKKLVEVLVSDENQVAAKAILLLLLTGARRNEITHARWQHVDLKASTLFVPLSKSGRPRYVFLNAAGVNVLRSVPRLPGNPYVFPSPVTGRPSASLHFPWNRIRTKAGLDDLRLHDLRHSFASALVNDGRELYTVQRLLGHANAKATQRYAHLKRETLAEAAETMGTLVSPILEETSKALHGSALKDSTPKQ
jgi:integrase